MEKYVVERIEKLICGLHNCVPEIKDQLWYKLEGFLDGLMYADVLSADEYRQYWERGFAAYTRIK